MKNGGVHQISKISNNRKLEIVYLKTHTQNMYLLNSGLGKMEKGFNETSPYNDQSEKL